MSAVPADRSIKTEADAATQGKKRKQGEGEVSVEREASRKEAKKQSALAIVTDDRLPFDRKKRRPDGDNKEELFGGSAQPPRRLGKGNGSVLDSILADGQSAKDHPGKEGKKEAASRSAASTANGARNSAIIPGLYVSCGLATVGFSVLTFPFRHMSLQTYF